MRKGVTCEHGAICEVMAGSEFFKTDVGVAAIPTLARFFKLCEYVKNEGNAPLLRHGEDQHFVGVLISGALTVRDARGNPLYSLCKDDTIGETLVAISREGTQPHDVYVRSPGRMLCTTIALLEDMQMENPLVHRQLIDAFIQKCMARTISETNYQPMTSDKKTSGPYVALIAHDAKKEALLEFCTKHKSVLARCKLTGTATTCSMLLEKVGLRSAFKVPSGPLGGDQSIGALIAHDLVDAVIFMKDSLSIQCHYADIEALCHLCDVRNVAHGTNAIMGDAIVHHLSHLMDLREGVIHVDPHEPELRRIAEPKPHESIMLRGQQSVESTDVGSSRSSVWSSRSDGVERTDQPSTLTDVAIRSLRISLPTPTPSPTSTRASLPSSPAKDPVLETLKYVEVDVVALAKDLSRHETFTSFEADEMELVCEMLEVVEAERGQQLIAAGSSADFALIVICGRVELLLEDEDGKIKTTQTLSSGAIYGQSNVIIDNQPTKWTVSAEAARRTRVAYLPRKEMQRLHDRNEDAHSRINLWLGVMVLRERHTEADEMGRKYIILTCDNTPDAFQALKEFVLLHHAFFVKHQSQLIGPVDVVAEVAKETGLTFVHQVQAPLLGGAMELGDLVCRTRVRAAVVFRDHRCSDSLAFEALLRVTDLYAVPSATNPTSANLLIKYLESGDSVV